MMDRFVERRARPVRPRPAAAIAASARRCLAAALILIVCFAGMVAVIAGAVVGWGLHFLRKVAGYGRGA